MPSKLVSTRQKSSEKVQMALRTHTERIVEQMDKMLGAGAGAHAQALLDAVHEQLVERTTTMVLADDAYQRDVADGAAPRQRRRAVADHVRGELIKLRGRIEASFGVDYARKVGFEGPTTQEPMAMRRLAMHVIERLRRVEQPEPTHPGVKFDLDKEIDSMLREIGVLDSVVEVVATGKREGEASMIGKRAAMSAFDRTCSIATMLTSTFLEVAGEREAALHVRPRNARVSRGGHPRSDDG